MSKLLIGPGSLVVGLIGGTVVGGSMLGGAATGLGIATGLSAGICATVTAATEDGLLTEDQVAQMLARATTDLGGMAQAGDLVGSTADCERVMQELMAAAPN
jgi:hypothetical protein